MPIPTSFEEFCRYLDGRVEGSVCVFDAGSMPAWEHDGTWAIGSYIYRTGDRVHRFVIVGRNGRDRLIVEPTEDGYRIVYEMRSGVLRAVADKTVTRKLRDLVLTASVKRGSNVIRCEATVRGTLTSALLEDIVAEFIDMVKELKDVVEEVA